MQYGCNNRAREVAFEISTIQYANEIHPTIKFDIHTQKIIEALGYPTAGSKPMFYLPLSPLVKQPVF